MGPGVRGHGLKVASSVLTIVFGGVDAVLDYDSHRPPRNGHNPIERALEMRLNRLEYAMECGVRSFHWCWLLVCTG